MGQASNVRRARVCSTCKLPFYHTAVEHRKHCQECARLSKLNLIHPTSDAVRIRIVEP